MPKPLDPRSLSAFHARLPYGERLSAEPVLGGAFFPFDGDVSVVPLDEPVVPEPQRQGEGGAGCLRCEHPDKDTIWRDARWRVHLVDEPVGLPFMACLAPLEHTTLSAMRPEVVADLGPLIQRVAAAIGRIEGVGRAHFSRWGDGSEHFHLWFLARPLGMMQMRGAMLAVWDDLLPRVPDSERSAAAGVVAAALAEGGGEAVGDGLR